MLASLKLKFILAILCVLCTNCGENSFKSAESSDPAEEAAKKLEQKQPDAAIDILLSALGSDIKAIYDGMHATDANGGFIVDLSTVSTSLNTQIDVQKNLGKSESPALVSILASAHGQKYGVDPFDIALELATGSGSSSSTAGSITALYPILPDSTAENKRGLSEAIAILNGIHSQDLTTADYFKKSLFLTANISLITKALDDDPADGNISALEASRLLTNDADALFDLINLAVDAVGSSGLSGSDSQGGKSAASINDIQSDLNNRDGDSNTEKARDFLASLSEE